MLIIANWPLGTTDSGMHHKVPLSMACYLNGADIGKNIISNIELKKSNWQNEISYFLKSITLLVSWNWDIDEYSNTECQLE